MCQVEFLVCLESRASKIGRADNRGNGREAFKATTAVEEIALGMQKPARVEAYLYMFLAQEGDEVFNQPERSFVKVLWLNRG